ncbi:aminoglycoside phosphotransferase family protein [Salininema proteolyticum]|uniref:Aminoglycoside phosphotransferase family protein n=1 Tax=Salininema proteolyticum TaxID=1607685 RepID=A0ABV8TW28_9ACTN
MRTPPADVDVDSGLARRLLSDQHPDLAGLPLALAANGWDNVVFRLGEDLVLRLPRRIEAAELIHNEQRWLGAIGARVDVAVPAPLRQGRPTDYYPYPWSVCAWTDGEAVSEVPVSDRSSLAGDLADFMTQMHTPAPESAPHNPVRGVPLSTRDGAMRERLASGLLPGSDVLGILWNRLRDTAPWDGPSLWIHGDPHPANLVASRQGGRWRLASVIDFGDLASGDPATDLSIAWTVFDEAGRELFRRRLADHGHADGATWERARGWALNMGCAMVAHSADNPRMMAIGRHTLEQVLLDEE